MRTRILILAMAFALAAPAFASSTEPADEHADEPAHEHASVRDPADRSPIDPASLRAVIDVRGLVCSFCAHGVEKALAKLDVLDSKHFGDGVLVEIEDQRVTLALRPDTVLPLADIHQRILDGGYEPVAVHLRVAGLSMQHGDQWVVHGTAPKLDISLPAGTELHAGRVELRVHVDAATLEALEPGQTVPVVLDEVL